MCIGRDVVGVSRQPTIGRHKLATPTGIVDPLADKCEPRGRQLRFRTNNTNAQAARTHGAGFTPKTLVL
jgi:hypothetical protein